LIDILMITHKRPEYTRRSLPHLLSNCDESMRVWVWHNGMHEETLEVVRSLTDHPRLHHFHHSIENKKLLEPTNWFWRSASGRYLSKVDDDCLVPEGWGETLRAVHEAAPELGVIACWRFREEDFVPEVAHRKIRTLAGGHQILQNCWVQGSSYLMKRDCFEQLGPLRKNEPFPAYCRRLAAARWMIGWYYPFLREENMDDPRSPYTILRTDEDLKRTKPLTAQEGGIRTLEERVRQIQEFALTCQTASIDPLQWVGWRLKLRRLRKRASSLLDRRRSPNWSRI
jgi:hypothetical protein